MIKISKKTAKKIIVKPVRRRDPQAFKIRNAEGINSK